MPHSRNMIFFFFERIIMLCVYIEKSLKLNCCWWENSLLDDDDDVKEEEEEKEEVEKSERKKPFLRFIGFEKHSTIFHVLSFLSLALMLILCWWWHTPMMTIERRWKINVYSKLINDFFWFRTSLHFAMFSLFYCVFERDISAS